MKKAIKILMFSLLFSTLCNAQSNNSCSGALGISQQQNQYVNDYSFNGENHFWMKYAADSLIAECHFLPDSLSSSTNINEIILYTGNDCSNLTMVWSEIFNGTDSIHSNTEIHFRFPAQSTNYFLEISKSAGASSGFGFRLGFPEIIGGCQPVCPDLISNGGFDIFNNGCVAGSNSHLCPDPVNSGCVCGWRASHGTPSFNPPNLFPIMGAIGVGNAVFGEGIYQNLQTTVLAGRNYLLSFSYQNAYGVGGYSYSLNAQLTNSAFNPGSCFEILPAPDWNIPGTPVPATTVYTTVRKCFTPNADYGVIRFYPTTNSTNSEWVSVDNVSLEVLDVPVEDKIIYCGQTVDLCPPCPSTNPVIQYLWSTGETTACLSVSPLVTTGYTLTVSVVDNGITICSYNLPVTVFVHPPDPITMISGSTTLCDASSSQTYCFNSNGATSYSFNVTPPNTVIPSGGCVQVNWTNIPASCATLEVTAYAGTCTTTASFQFCAPCQGSPSLLTFCDVSASDILNSPLYTAYISNGNVLTVPPGSWATFHGTFTIDVPFVISNSDIRFGSDAKVVINNFQVLKVVSQSHLHSCNGINMWDGIYTEDPSSLVYISNGINLIEDAKNAVVSSNGGNFQINSTTFNNNYIGVLVNTYSNGHPGKIWGCKFTGTGTLLSPYSNYCSLNYPLCGIQLSEVEHIQIGEPVYYNTLGRNIFQSVLCGIFATNSGFDVYTSEFIDILSPAFPCMSQQGCGIYARGNTAKGYRINVGNNSPSELCRFIHCRIGILERTNCYGEIRANVFEHCDNGIINQYCSRYSNLVKGNSFEDFKRGIYFFNAVNQSQYGLEIYENIFNTSVTTFNSNTYGKQAINVTNAVSAATNLWVTGNVINYSRVGIFVRNVWEPCNIRSNTINFDILPHDAQNIGRHHGIVCENDNGLQIDANYIRWKNQPNAPMGFINYMNGITVNNSTNNTVISGGIFENKIGPYPAVNSGSTYGMGSGINISGDCMGLSLYCNKMNRCEEGVTFRNASLGPQGYQDHQQNWYTNGNTFSYTPNQGGNFRIGGTVFSQVHWPYIGGIDDPFPYQIFTVLPFPTIFNSFHCMTPSPADDEKREDEFGALIDTASQQLNPDYSGYEEQLKYATKEKFYAGVKVDSSILNLGSINDNAYQGLFEDLDNSNIARLHEVKTFVDSMDYSAAGQKLLLIVDSNFIEHNKKVAMQVFLETFASDIDPDSTQIVKLEPISNMNPVIGGEGVFWACAMLDKDINNELPPLRKSKSVENVYSSGDIRVEIFPNPAKNLVVLNYNSEVPLTLHITDATGKIVYQKYLDNNSQFESIVTTSWSPGTYTVNLSNENRIVYVEKLIIIK